MARTLKDQSGINNGFYGKSHSVKTKQQISQSKIGQGAGNKNPKSKTWIFIDPDLKEYIVEGQFHNFCYEHDLSPNTMRHLFDGAIKQGHSKGWQIFQIDSKGNRWNNNNLYQQNYLATKKYITNYSRMKKNIRNRIRNSIRNQCSKKTLLSFELLGCTGKEAHDYLESKFQKGMTWNNYGFGDDKWHIDHIIPCDAFDLTNEDEQKKCFHYTNLQPLWQRDNLRKSNKILEA
jgi:hypothetical protein